MAEGGDVPIGAEGDPTISYLGGCEPPGSARPGSSSGGQTGGRNSAALPVKVSLTLPVPDRQGCFTNGGLHNILLMLNKH